MFDIEKRDYGVPYFLMANDYSDFKLTEKL